MKVRLLVVCMWIAVSSGQSAAYELATHGLLTLRAYQLSSIGQDPTRREAIGLSRYVDVIPSKADNPFGNYYLDLATEVVRREAQRYEKDLMPRDSLGFQRDKGALQVEGWLMRGAIREDDTSLLSLRYNDDPINANRPLNHFFDPKYNISLTVGGQVGAPAVGAKNPNWALGVMDAFADPLAEDSNRLNHFSVFDAREAMWRALTLRNKQGLPAETAGLPAGGGVRKAYWATTFRALGDLVHMIQDVAQPQHTRNEPHMGKGWEGLQRKIIGHGSVMEEYFDVRALGERDAFTVNVGTGGLPIKIGPPEPLPLDRAAPLPPYPIPAFTRYSEFFSTSVGSDAALGRGMADYSNRGFFTQVKNFGHPDYQKPTSDPAAYIPCVNPVDQSPRTVKNWDGSPLPEVIEVQLLCGSVRDDFTTTTDANVAMTSQSQWDQFLIAKGVAPTYHLVRDNYDDQAKLLLPRAVAYSAGLLNYFFRGQMTVSMPDEGAYAVADHSTGEGFKVIKAKLTNTTPGEAMSAGKVVAVVKFHRNNGYTSDLSGEYGARAGDVSQRAGGAEDLNDSEEIVVSAAKDLTLASGEQVTLSFDFSQNPIPLGSSDLFLQVVYRGKLGNEDDAVAVATIDLSEPTYFAYLNASDYIQLAGLVYTRDEVNASTTLLDLVRPQTCVDRTQSPPRLVDSCFLPHMLDIDLSLGSLEAPTIRATALPPRRFLRFAFLTDADPVRSPKSANAPRVSGRVSPASEAGLEKATVSQNATCYPLDPIGVTPVTNQVTALTLEYIWSGLNQVRGIWSRTQTSCVISGDLSPVLPDNRNTKMSALVGGETSPYAVTVLGAFLTP